MSVKPYFLLVLLCSTLDLHSQDSDAIYPVNANYEADLSGSVNLFTGQIGRSIDLFTINGPRLSWKLQAYYNSASAAWINRSAANYQFTPLGGYGWKMMDYPKIVQDGNNYFLLDGYAACRMKQLGSDPDTYCTGGKYYTWRIFHRSNDRWEIAREDGTHFYFRSSPQTLPGQARVWSFTVIKQPQWGDSLQFAYRMDGNLSMVWDLTGDTVQLEYTNRAPLNKPYLNAIIQSKRGIPVYKVELGYTDYTLVNQAHYWLLSSVLGRWYRNGIAYGGQQAPLQFSYSKEGDAAPPGCANYPGGLKSVQTSEGALYTYYYALVSQAFRVIRYSVNTGYGRRLSGRTDPNIYTSISYSATGGGANGAYSFYNKVTVAPGETPFSNTPDGTHPYGTIDYYFFTGADASQLQGLPGAYRGTATTDTLFTGLVYRKMINMDSGAQRQLVPMQSAENDWEISSLSNQVRFPLLKRTYDTYHGAGKWISYTYGTRFMLPVQIATSRGNSTYPVGLTYRDSMQTLITYAFEAFPSLASDSIYCLNQTIRTVNRIAHAPRWDFQAISCNCTIWHSWSRSGNDAPGSGYYAPWQTVQNRFPNFNPNDCLSYTQEKSSPAWLVTGRVNKRGDFGIPLDSVAGDDHYSVIMAKGLGGNKEVARFFNARVEDLGPGNYRNADYLGFESYETHLRNWTILSGAVHGNMAHTGANSFSGSLETTFQLLDKAPRLYVAGTWAYLAAAGDQCTITLKTQDGQILATRTVAYNASQPSLRYIEVRAVMSPGQTVTLSLASTGSGFLDDISFMPWDADLKGIVYDPLRNEPIAQIGPHGQTTHFVYDRANTLIAQVGPGTIQNINDLQMPYNSRLNNRILNGKDSFSPIYPNMRLEISARSDGNWQGFQYSSNNSFPTAGLKNMIIRDGLLTATDTPAAARFNQHITTGHFGVFSEWYPNNPALGEEMGYFLLVDSINSMGGVYDQRDLKVFLGRDGYKLYLGNTLKKRFPLAGAPAAASVLIEISGSRVTVYADGRYLFEQDLGNVRIKDAFALVSYKRGAAFDNFFYVAAPSVFEQTLDALNRPRQCLQRSDNEHLSVQETLYGGALDLPMADTRPTTIGGRETNLGFFFRPDFAGIFNADSMTLEGPSLLDSTADYQHPFQHSMAYSRCPTLEISAVGGGADRTAGMKGDHCTRLNYNNRDLSAFGYTGDQMMVMERTDPNLVRTLTFQNHDQTTFAQYEIHGTDTLKTTYAYDDYLHPIFEFLPNRFSSGLSDHDQQFREYTYSIAGEKEYESDPDGGSRQFIYSPGGRLRFSADNRTLSNPNRKLIVYYKYDGLGRLIEKGTLKRPWNRDSLRYYADQDEDYPTAAQLATAEGSRLVQYCYDGTDNLYDAGKLTRVISLSSGASAQTVTEFYHYDIYGHIISKGLSVTGASQKTWWIDYQYDLQGKMTRIEFPGTRHPAILYTYDGEGKVMGVGIPNRPNYYAAYHYGYNTIEYLNDHQFARTYDYNDEGRLTSINDPLFNETLSYKSDGSGTHYDYNGKIASAADILKWRRDTLTARYRYDGHSRLTNADYGPNSPWTLGRSYPIRYDDNGNVLLLQQGSDPASVYHYTAGTNRLQNISGSTGMYQYDAAGDLTGITGRLHDITYAPISDRTLQVFHDQTQVQYQYDGDDRRVLKTVTQNGQTSQRLYLHGLSAMPLSEINFTSGGGTIQTFYIYGPQGLVAIEQGAQRLYALKDHLGSIRLLIDSNQKVDAAFDYGPLGNTISSYIDTGVRTMALNYRFTGQEWEGELGGLYNFKARFYDPSTGRFLTPDPLLQTPNSYEYAFNNPVNFSDPTGTWSLPSWSDVAAVGAGIVGGAAVVIGVVVTAPVSLPALAVGSLAVGAGALAGGITEGVLSKAGGGDFGSGFVRGLGFGALGGGIAFAGSGLLGGGFFASALAEGAVAGTEEEVASLISRGMNQVGQEIISRLGLRIAAQNMLGLGALTAFAGLGLDLLTNLQASADGIQCCEPLDAAKLGLPNGRNIKGGFSAIVDLTRAQPFVNDGSYRCPPLSCRLDTLDSEEMAHHVYSQHIIHSLLDSNRPADWHEFWYLYEPWSTMFPEETLYINGGFFYPDVDSYIDECTDVQGIWVANNKIVSADHDKAYWEFSGESHWRYNLDALVFYEHPEDNGGKYAECIAYDSTRFFGGSFLRKVKIAVSGVFFVRDGVDYTDHLPEGIIAREERFARTAIGISSDGTRLYILQVSNDYSQAQNGITFQEAASWFLRQGCRTAIMLDGSASSQLYYQKNGQEFQSYPMERLSPFQAGHCNQTWITPSMQQFRPVHQFLGFK